MKRIRRKKSRGRKQTVNYRGCHLFAVSGILLTMDRRAAARISSPAKSPAAPDASRLDCRIGCCSETSTPRAIGLRWRLRRSDVANIGSRSVPTITQSLPARPTRCRSLWRSPSAARTGLAQICRYDDPCFLRPSEVDILCRDSSKARNILPWEPRVKFNNLISIMVDADPEPAREELRRGKVDS